MNQENLPSYLKRLNPAQREAALASEGPVLVLAGAGSGKTSMLTSRIATLVDQRKVEPHRILAVTFTNKAAGEMRSRIEKVLTTEIDTSSNSGSASHLGRFGLSLPEVGTFHSVCIRWLRRRLDLTPFDKSFVIFDDSDQVALIKSVIKKLDYDPKNFHPRGIQSWINIVKCRGLEPKEVVPETRSPFEKVAMEVYTTYQRELYAHGALDFGEILCLTYRMLRDSEEFRKGLQSQLQYFHVDEYQDTNRVQYEILSLLTHPRSGGNSNLCVVGDEDQSIYKWRGADIRNILDFEKDFGQAKIFKLEQNYRSTKNIIEAASQVISHNTERKPKKLWTDNPVGSKVLVLRYPDDRGEAEGVIREIRRELSERRLTLEQVALFYRTHAQSRPFEDVLRREKIPYQVVGGLRFYDRAEIKDILAFMRLIHNPRDALSLRRIINVPTRGIGKTTLEALDQVLAREDTSDLWSLLVRMKQGLLGAEIESLNDRAKTKIFGFVKMVETWMQFQPSLDMAALYHRILDDTGYVVELRKEETIEAEAKIENLEEFDNVIQEFHEGETREASAQGLALDSVGSLAKFLEQTTLASSTDTQWQAGSLRLMTLHAAKGLEFPLVALVGMEDGLLPSTQSWEEADPAEIEEERRLCYVGFTRAQERLLLSFADLRRIRGEMFGQEPSRFLREFSPELMDTRGGSLFRNKGGASASSDSFQETVRMVDDPKPTWVGHRINHPQYGMGTIMGEEGSGAGLKVMVEFTDRNSQDSRGGRGTRVQKKFLMKFLLEMMR